MAKPIAQLVLVALKVQRFLNNYPIEQWHRFILRLYFGGKRFLVKAESV
jgi:hypothetical protein